MTNDRLTALALVSAILICLGVSIADNANAKTYKPKPLTSVGQYTYKLKTAQHIYCPYKGCKSKFH
jgi:hypothetical protein